MARGQAGASDAQLHKTNDVAIAQGKETQNLENQVMPGYTSLMDTGYLSPEEEHAATTSEMGSATQPFQSMEFKAGNRAAATRNPADLTAEDTQLALDEGRTAGGAAEQLQKEKMANQISGMEGIAGQEAGNRHTMESMYGLGPGTLDARAAGKSGDELGMGWVTAGSQAVAACPVAGMKILMADGSKAAVETLRSGDMVLGIDRKPDELVLVEASAPQRTCKVSTDSHTVQVSLSHSFVRTHGGYTLAKESAEESVKMLEGEQLVLTVTTEAEAVCYRLETRRTHSYCVEGFWSLT